MKAIIPGDVRRLRGSFPNLLYDGGRRRIEGELDFCAAYDASSGQLLIERNVQDGVMRQSNSFIADVYEIEICFDSQSLGVNGWPKVYEVGGRRDDHC